MVEKNSPVRETRRLDDLLRADVPSAFVLSAANLRALVLVDIGARRWRMGLTMLGRQIYLNRNAREITELEHWGLIVDVPDDSRWLYYLAPSPLGMVHLRSNPDVARLKAEIRASEIVKCEIADGGE